MEIVTQEEFLSQLLESDELEYEVEHIEGNSYVAIWKGDTRIYLKVLDITGE